jgi:uncharacterized LabA/DUF88 family protein
VPDQVAVFIDYQNVHLTARNLFLGRGVRAEMALVDPIRAAERIAAKRRRHSTVSSLRVFRGRPSPRHHPVMTAANDAQTKAWERDPRVRVVRRDLVYRDWPARPPIEKGVDVALSADLIRSAMLEQYDVGIVFSADMDLLPAVETAFHLTAPHIEVACWRGLWPLWFPDQTRHKRYLPYCHFLDADDFEAVRDRRTYV